MPRLVSPLKWSDYVRPICLPPVRDGQVEYNENNIKKVTIAGYGATGFDRKAKGFDFSTPQANAIYLKRAKAIIVPITSVPTDCYTHMRILPSDFRSSYMFCSYNRPNNQAVSLAIKEDDHLSTGACYGDLGGPALLLDHGNGFLTIHGVITRVSKDCDKYGQTDYIKVSQIINWIKVIVIRDFPTSPPEPNPRTQQLDQNCGWL